MTSHLAPPPPVEPGDGWTCAEGHRHFVCYRCHDVFTTVAVVDHTDLPNPNLEDDEDEGTFSMCDDCSTIVLADLRARGIIP